MNGWIIALLFGALILFVIGIVTFISIMNRKNSNDELDYSEMGGENPPIVLNLTPDKTMGHALLAVHKVDGRVGYNSPALLHCFPKDIQTTNGKGSGRANTHVELRVAPNCLIALPNGRLSQHRDIFIAHPSDVKDIPEDLKDTWLGTALQERILMIRVLKPMLDAYSRGDKAKAEIMEEMNSGEMTRELYEKLNAMNKISFEQFMQSSIRDIEAGRKPIEQQKKSAV